MANFLVIFGCKEGLRLCLQFPALAVAPVLSPWMLVKENMNYASAANETIKTLQRGEPKDMSSLRLSPLLTWTNHLMAHVMPWLIQATFLLPKSTSDRLRYVPNLQAIPSLVPSSFILVLILNLKTKGQFVFRRQ